MITKNEKVIGEFGEEWTKFDYSSIDTEKLNKNFDQYFYIFSLDVLPKNAVGSDLGCGNNRLAQLVVPKS